MRTVCRVARGCTFCNTCVFECPIQAIRMTGDGAWIDEERCTGCGICIPHCASEAIIRVAAPGEASAASAAHRPSVEPQQGESAS